MDSFIELFKQKVSNNKKMTLKQQQILNVSIDLFSQKGFANTSTSEIAKQANVAEGTIFKHFGNKENLLYATVIPLMMTDVLPEMIKKAEAEQPNLKELSFEDFIHYIVYDRLQVVDQHYKMTKIFFTELIYHDDMRKKMLALVPNNTLTSLFNILDHYKKNGQIEDWPNPVIFRFIMSSIMGYISEKDISPQTKSEDQFFKELIYLERFIIKGLQKNEN
ncbi:TetR/AcrR family transcriptional regulator [Carnobacterium antarcticum]|uniref:TetR/AcrR family transcriptional regulator n=1 Tax=Carnobacterium antarcticum TaxID=2126436 RepID=A0ABW4NJZ4_9LACT|nr:TetR/AcrR family transcriptional regulator [Carnobacterium sp. CP1]ALV21812.1 Transcriptional regulator, TetR [Carnobacterium sp. CP1]